ncbi:hypothetical protein EC970264_A0134 [Escherichia coli 97.0264]|uniref:Uncharacterized protein n=1 Tax=Salmonella enterica subsp. enterica serovar Heidelberg TaxID=611 RepID=H9TIZ9_SALET|nr:hypothetical protein pSH163_120_9 [Salmonella enterica subsp. enterica serovar Heidelberg]KIO88526.1 hypothetical protein EC970264_A0134 [Escherichia coli 97.0264]
MYDLSMTVIFSATSGSLRYNTVILSARAGMMNTRRLKI